MNHSKLTVCRAAAILSLAIVAGCVTQKSLTVPPHDALGPVVCDATSASRNQCDRIWQRAHLWFTQNSQYRVQTVSAELIQSAGPRRGEITPIFRVVRETLPDRKSRISVAVGCENMSACDLRADDTIKEIIKYVLVEDASARSGSSGEDDRRKSNPGK